LQEGDRHSEPETALVQLKAPDRGFFIQGPKRKSSAGRYLPRYFPSSHNS
jgi:hypothetical protein